MKWRVAWQGHAGAYHAASLFYFVGLGFGVLAAIGSGRDFAEDWLVASYVLLAALAASDLVVGRCARRVERAVAGSSSATDLPAWTQTPLPLYSLAAKTTLTVAVVS